MKNSLFVFLLILVFSLSSQAQFIPTRYYSQVFQNVTETTNVLFSTNVPVPEPGGGFYESITNYPVNVKEYEFYNQNLYMNIIQPQGDTISNRPVVILCFGGGFVAGSKDHWSMRLIAIDLAKRGYVAALIDYRLGMNLFDAELSKRAVYRGVQDGRSAVRFFKADAAGANTYRVDPEEIYIGGHSAGAFIALHNAYLDTETERPPSTGQWTQSCGFLGWSNCTCPDQGCLDCVGNNQGYSGHAKALFSLAGAVGSIQYIESSDDPKLVMFHSTDDGTVPYTSGEPFGDISPFILGSDLPMVYGSQPISTQADAEDLTYNFHSYTSRGHGVHENESNNTLYSDIMPKITQFFYTNLLKPLSHSVDGNRHVCESNLIQSYKIKTPLAPYYQWIISGGTFIQNPLPNDTLITVQWDVNSSNHTLTVVPYSKHWARGDTIMTQVTVSPSGTNTWQGQNNLWNAYTNWSLYALPQQCHDVIIPQIATGDPLIPDGTQVFVRSVTSYNPRSLTIASGASLTIVPQPE
ncbi:MAG: alpha/beta hydrolase [Saprospiraceae bacterium]